MYLRVRHRLLFAVAVLWLVLIWLIQLGAPGFEELLTGLVSGAYRERFSTLEVLLCLAGLVAAMMAVDRLWWRYMRRRFAVDSMTVHWSKLRNRDGQLICAACHGVFLLPPEDFSDEGWVHCGDCGHAVAPYGEMKPVLKELRAIYTARWSWRLR